VKTVYTVFSIRNITELLPNLLDILRSMTFYVYFTLMSHAKER